ncbi:Gfo/Idh/MocA family oxidoreductase [Pelagibacteraceae bacterium]|nr:Gfo/Idh/MocA family oxidoreductase [Pelagibacteraceae bacterium]
MTISALVIGYGSIGQRHVKILKNKLKIKDITISTKKKLNGFNTIGSLYNLKKKPSYVIIASPTIKHFEQLKIVEKNFKGVSVLVEKPLFDSYKKLKVKNNKVFVGYNLRFHPILKYIKKNIKNKKIFDIKIICNSYLPDWRTNISYKKSSSAKRNMGGGVVLDLSHELDFVRWLFGDINIKFVQRGKFSNLLINTDDLLKLYGTIGKINISIDLNYYSKIKRRTISIDGKNFSIFADLFKNELEIKTNKKSLIKKFGNLRVDDTYLQQHKAILSKNLKDVCNYSFALGTMKLIKSIQNWKKSS